MPDGHVRAELDGLRSARTQFTQVGNGVEAVLSILAAKVDSEGKCWGSDEPGAGFSSGYPESRQRMEAGLQSLQQRLRNIVDHIGTTADNFERQDQSGSLELRRASGEL